MTLDAGTGRLVGLRMVPMQAGRTRLRAASGTDTTWLRDVLDPLCADAHIELGRGGALVLR